MQKLIPANKNANYQIKEKEQGFYHLKFVVQIPTATGATITDEAFQIFSVDGFKKFLENKNHFNFKSEEIIHDPTLVVAKPSADPHDVEEEIAPKKQAYFGSDKWRADMEAKKQLKQQKQ